MTPGGSEHQLDKKLSYLFLKVLYLVEHTKTADEERQIYYIQQVDIETSRFDR